MIQRTCTYRFPNTTLTSMSLLLCTQNVPVEISALRLVILTVFLIVANASHNPELLATKESLLLFSHPSSTLMFLTFDAIQHR
jgi:hypothetical protein